MSIRSAYLVLVLLLSATDVLPEALSPPETVRALILAARSNDLDGVLLTADMIRIAQGHHGRPPADTIAFLRRIDPNQLSFVGGRTSWSPAPKEVKVSLRSPLMVDFDLEILRANELHQEDRYVVVSIHP